MVSITFHQTQNDFSNWNILYAVLFEKQYIKIRTFNDKNRWIIKKVMFLKKLLPHLATRGTYSPGDWRCDEAWREQTLVYPPVMCQQRLIYCTWELNVMPTCSGMCPQTPPLSMMTSSNGTIFRDTGHLCGEFTGEFPAQKPVTRSFDVFFDLRLNKRLIIQLWDWWFET